MWEGQYIGMRYRCFVLKVCLSDISNQSKFNAESALITLGATPEGEVSVLDYQGLKRLDLSNKSCGLCL